MTDGNPAAGSRSGSDAPGPRRLLKNLEELVRNSAPEGAPLPTELEAVIEADDLEDAWEELRSLHLTIDRWREEGEISAEEARELRSRIVDLSGRVAAGKVEDEARTCSRLLRDVSHDIRSPLHSIVFLAEALYSGRSGSLEEGDRQQIGTIYAASTSLLNLVNDLLDYARMAEGGKEGEDEIEETPFALTSVLSDVRHLVTPLVEHHGTDCEIRSPEHAGLRGDPHLLCRVLTNLISNAVEAAGREGTVRVRIEPREEGTEIEVTDDGEEDDVDRMERLLSQPEGETLADSVGEKRQGRTHGLGLLISGRLVDTAGGWAEVERVPADRKTGGENPSRRTRIRVWLPFGREDGG